MSQEYTPVSWQDETTSQQGTLINAERLNQMQTAHHYADGFEEVDEIPTEDPGTAYHKIVYCTEDSAFYRWDGTQWAKDVDDVTRAELDAEIERAEHAEGLIQGYLDAHEANHNNPHQVTKAQVGLGNCDNTADLDKPISTAVQAALDTKADKASTLAGYGITDSYTKAQADTLLADKADKADVYDKTAADTLLAGKVDKLVSSPAGTYKSVTVNAQGQVTAGTNPDTLAGFGITDAYNKTEADNLLAAKADATALTDGSVTKVGTADVGTDTKPIKLVAGVPTAVGYDLVTTDTAQTIGGAKTLTAAPTILANNDFAHIDIKSTRASGNLGGILFKDGTGTTVNSIYSQVGGLMGITLEGTTKALLLTGQRDYNAANVNDIATIKTLDQYGPMVRTANAQTIGGVKTFTSIIAGSAPGKYVGICGPTQAASGQFYKMAEIDTLPNNDGVVFTIYAGLNGSVYARATYRVYRASGVLYVQCLDRCYTTIYQKPKIYGIISGSGVIIYADTLSWCKPHLYLNYWETQGEIYASMAQHTLTLSNDWSIIEPPAGIVEEVKLSSD